MNVFDAETAIAPDGPGRWSVDLTTNWDIGDNANGGYLMMPVLRALAEIGGHADPISVTTHFLRPVQGGGRAQVGAEQVRRGRTVSVARGGLSQDDKERLVVIAALGELDGGQPSGAMIDRPAPDIPGPDDCVDRSGASQGVDLPLAGRVTVRLPPERTRAGGSDEAVTEGWIRLVDGTPPSALVLPLFADAFPPSLFSRFGRVGWVPTIELTVHVRRRPAPGWIQARFECDDLADGRMVESGVLWDSTGRVVARSRQLGLLLTS